MRGDVLDGAEDPLLELDVLGNRLEDELASAKISGEAGRVLAPASSLHLTCYHHLNR